MEVEQERTPMSDKQLGEYRAVFNLYDKDRVGYIASDKLGMVLRSLGQTPSEETLNEICGDVEDNQEGKVTFDEFVKILDKVSGEKLSVEDLQDAFKVFDKMGNGTVPAEDLRHYLTTLGEKLSEEEVDELIASAEVDSDGNIDYAKFSQKLMA